MKPSSAKAKGKLLEDHVADQIVAKGLDPKARRDGASGAGNREKGDIITSLSILGQNVGIEVKNQANLAIPEWWRQTKKLESLGCEPLLVFKIYGEPLEETKVVMYLDTLLEVLKNQKSWVEQAWNSSKKIEHERAIEQIISAAKILER